MRVEGHWFGGCSKGWHIWRGKWYWLSAGNFQTAYRRWICVSREDGRVLGSDYKIGPTIRKEHCELL